MESKIGTTVYIDLDLVRETKGNRSAAITRALDELLSQPVTAQSFFPRRKASRGSVCITLPLTIFKKLNETAEQCGVPISWIVERALELYLKKE